MKSLKIAVVTSLMLLLATVALAADQAKKEKAKGPKLSPIAETMLRVDRLKAAMEGLDLSEDQKGKLVQIRDEFEAKRQSLHEKIGELLSDDQRQVALTTMESAKQSGKNGREMYMAIEAALKLTDEQKQKMEPIGKEFQGAFNDAMKKVMDILTAEQKEKIQQKLGGGKKAKKEEKK